MREGKKLHLSDEVFHLMFHCIIQEFLEVGTRCGGSGRVERDLVEFEVS
jgi:hypothetical protein